MNSDEHQAIKDALCPDCAGLLRLPETPLPASLLRWCICDLSAAEEKRGVLGFTMKTKKSINPRG